MPTTRGRIASAIGGTQQPIPVPATQVIRIRTTAALIVATVLRRQRTAGTFSISPQSPRRRDFPILRCGLSVRAGGSRHSENSFGWFFVDDDEQRHCLKWNRKPESQSDIG